MRFFPGSAAVLKRIGRAYRTGWWTPSVVYLALILAGLGLALVPWRPCQAAAALVFGGGIAAFAGILVASALRFVDRKVVEGFYQLLLAVLCLVASAVAVGAFVAGSLFGPSEDGFADGLAIPEGMKVAEPFSPFSGESLPTPAEDKFQRALKDALKAPATGDATVRADLPSLLRLQATRREALQRYLASHPGWRVFRERGKLYATRRWSSDAGWCYTLHGYYGSFGGDAAPAAESFQTRLTLGLDGEPWARVQGNAIWLEPGSASLAKLDVGNALQESWVLVRAGDWVVEVFEQSGGTERRLTKAALKFLEDELAPFAEDASWARLRASLPADAIVRGESSLDLRESFQPGIYDVFIRANPGEPGTVYLKAFEVTRGTRLSADRLTERSNERMGWSEDPAEQFFSNTHVTIYEGDWGKPYAARFELWFKPDSGGSERKLFEKVYKIEGWQR